MDDHKHNRFSKHAEANPLNHPEMLAKLRDQKKRAPKKKKSDK